MIELPIEVIVVRVDTQQPVRARLIELSMADALDRIEKIWWTEFPIAEPIKKKEIDRLWEWDSVVRSIQWDYYTSCVAIQTLDDGLIHGAMALEAPVRSILENDKFAVYIARLATAPRNRPWLNPPNGGLIKCRGAGVALINYAKSFSYDLRLDGRVNLKVRRGTYAEGFYRRRGFQQTNIGHTDMILMELPAGT